MGQKGFAQGHPKYGGRVAGRPSHAKLRVMEVKQTFIDAKMNPILEMIKVARSKEPVPEHRIKALTELCKYFAPRLTTQNVSIAVKGNVQIEELQKIAMVDDAVFQAMEMLSLKMSELESKAAGEIIDVRPALPEPAPVFPERSPASD
jgi:hypothetical protein